MIRPLLVGALSTGALLGTGLSAGTAGFSTVQAALYPEQFGAWGWNAGQILFITFVGFAIGAVAGLATGAGSVAALWITATTSSTPALPRTLTAGLGAGVTTFLYTAVVVSVSGLPGLAAAGIGAVLAAVAGSLAAFHTRRLIRKAHPGTPKPAHKHRPIPRQEEPGPGTGFPVIPVRAWIRFPDCAELVDGEVSAWTAKAAEVTRKNGPVTYRTWARRPAVTPRKN